MLGLGNPGWRYKGTRHNIGFRAIEELAGALPDGDAKWENATAFQCLLRSTHVANDPVVLAKPLTYMNHSGVTAKRLLDHHEQQAQSLIVLHDDKDIALGKLKVQRNRGHGGHNGIKSIIEHLGTRDFTRIRIGVGCADNAAPQDTVRFVLGRFTWRERSQARKAVSLAVERTRECLVALDT